MNRLAATGLIIYNFLKTRRLMKFYANAACDGKQENDHETLRNSASHS